MVVAAVEKQTSGLVAVRSLIGFLLPEVAEELHIT